MAGNPVAFSIPCGTDLEWRRIQRVLHMVAHKHCSLCVFDFCVSMVYGLLFTIAGMSCKYALLKRTNKQLVAERIKKLVIPFFFICLSFL